ncbi:MAG: tetratricopeptide repeat protein [Patescibacteria group bacterium]
MNWKSGWFWLLLIWIVGIVAYSNTLSSPFVFDDLVEIVGNAPLRDFDMVALVQRYPTRIIPYLTLAANYALSGENTVSYHAVNILTHLLSATVIFFLVRELGARTRYKEQAHIIAGATALLFISHPVQTQAVTYIIQRLASHTALLYLTGLLLYVLARKRGLSTGLPPSLKLRRTGRVSSWNWLYLLSWLAILLAMFSKEIAFTAPIAILMIEWFFFQGSPSPAPFHSKHPTSLKLRGAGASLNAAEQSDMLPANGLRTPSQQGLSRQVLDSGRLSQSANRSRGDSTRPEQVMWWVALLYLSLLLVIPLILLVNRPPLVERDNPLVENAAVQPGRPLVTETSSITRSEYLLTQINVVRTYLRLLILPIHQNLDYDYPISHSLLEARTLGSLVLLLTILGLGAWLYPRNRLASFGIFFLFLALSVESSFIPIRDVIYEHRLYLPSFGFFLAASAVAAVYFPRRVLLPLGLAVVVIFAGATIARNGTWQSEQGLWLDVVEKSPLKARGWNNLGVAYTRIGDGEQAEGTFREAISLNPNYAEAYNNLGLLKAQQEEYDTALELFKKATELEPLYTHAFNNLGVAYLKVGQPENAVAPLEMAVGTDDLYIDAKLNLAVAYLANGENDKAREQAEVVLEREPRSEGARRLLEQLH